MSIYSAPRCVKDINDCYFYHTMDLPGIGTVKGNWDLRSKIKDYLGHVKFEGKRVLDVGAASGLLSFYMESQGAEVVSFDLDKSYDWDVVPFAKWDYQEGFIERRQSAEKLNNAYWFAHRALNSKATAVYGNVYAIPGEIGPVDVSVYGSILLHLRDPFLALQNGLKLTREIVIVSEVNRGQTLPTTEPYLGFLPDSKTIEPKRVWWDVRPEWSKRVLAVLGFEDASTTYHTQDFEGREIELFTVVAHRTHGSVRTS
jgi:hypothetical protein